MEANYDLLEESPRRRVPLVVALAGIGSLALCAACGLAYPASGVTSVAEATDLDATVQSKRLPEAKGYASGEVNTPKATNATRLRPVVMFHGAAESQKEFLLAKQWIDVEHPGTWTVLVNLYSGAESFTPLEEQVRGLYAYLLRLEEDFPKEFKDGYNLLCHSQGALVCRVTLQVMQKHNVLHFISLAGPQMGVYGTTWLRSAQPFLEKTLPIPVQLPPFIPASIMSMGATVLASNFHTLAYGSLQNSTSLANLWHDPLHQREYLKGNAFLPRANGEEGLAGRSNFVRLRKAVFLVGSFERHYDSPLGLEPWQTGIFGFYKAGSDTELLPMEEQEVYKKDSFGLRTLHQSGRLHLEAIPKVEHGDWLTQAKVFKRHVLPHLA